MQDMQIERIRDRLQKRFRDVHLSDQIRFHPSLKQFFSFVDSTPMLQSVQNELVNRTQSLNVNAIVDRLLQGDPLLAKPEEELAAIGFTLLGRFVANPESVCLTTMTMRWGVANHPHKAFAYVAEALLNPLHRYLDEHIEDQQALLYVLRQYKQRCEWFRRGRLWRLANKRPRIAERLLVTDLFEYSTIRASASLLSHVQHPASPISSPTRRALVGWSLKQSYFGQPRTRASGILSMPSIRFIRTLQPTTSRADIWSSTKCARWS